MLRKLVPKIRRKSAAKTPHHFRFNGRKFCLRWERGNWRLRSTKASFMASYSTGLSNAKEAEAAAKEWLQRREAQEMTSHRGGGTLEALAQMYLKAPKRAKGKVAESNVGRLRTVCGKALGRALSSVTCREVGPELWQKYQRAVLEEAGHEFNLSTRYRENIPINACIRAAKSIFLKALLPAYRAAGLDVRADAGVAMTLPTPHVKPAKVDDTRVLESWRALEPGDAMWLTIGLARFAGLRREELAACRVGWIEEREGAITIYVADRPEEKFWTKTGKPHYAPVIEPTLSEWLAALKHTAAEDALVIPDPGERWFEWGPQVWLVAAGFPEKVRLKLHRLRGLYADHIARITKDAVAARLAGIRAAQGALGHTTSATTEKHYLSGE